MAMLVAVPLLSLVLVRMLWSGSALWFLAVGILLLGAAAVIYLARRPHELEYGPALGQDTSRLPLIMSALGVLFLAMLLLPNFAGDNDASFPSATQQDGLVSDVSGVSVNNQDQAQPDDPAAPAADSASDPPASDAEQTYVVQSGDTVWAIAERFSTTIDAIIDANGLANPGALQVGQELVIPVGDAAESAGVAP